MTRQDAIDLANSIADEIRSKASFVCYEEGTNEYMILVGYWFIRDRILNRLHTPELAIKDQS